MFLDYQSLVLWHYERKRNENQLPLGLSQPTTAKLKAACLAKSAVGFSQKDRKILVDFFGEGGDDGAILKRIKNCEADTFKPLWNYLKKKTTNTDAKNIELLAWLTDFNPRPFDYTKIYVLDSRQAFSETPEAFLDVAQNKEEKEKQAEKIEQNKIPKVDIQPSQVSAPVVPNKITTQVDDIDEKAPLGASLPIAAKRHIYPKAIITALLIVISTVVVFYIHQRNEEGSKTMFGSNFNKEGGCMYWAGDHYQQVICSQKMGSDTLVIALDTEKLNSLRKITRRDTITKNSKGSVWYIKVNNKVEFYTAGGNYPLDPTLKLKPITDYIIDKYIGTIQQDVSR